MNPGSGHPRRQVSRPWTAPWFRPLRRVSNPAAPLPYLLQANRINNEGSKFPSVQLFSVLPLILEHILTSDGHYQASSKKYIKEIAYNCINP